jgi:glycosyltransferase involved in cell wall biosynthesis
MSTARTAQLPGIEAYLVGLRYGHHSHHAGYEGFGRYLGAPLPPPVRFRYLDRAWRVDAAVCSLVGKPFYSLALLLTESAAALHMLGHRRAVYHVIYCDTDLRLLGPAGRLAGASVVATFHEPDWSLEWLGIDRTVTRDLAAIILMSESQRPFFEEIAPPERIFVVPHGIDTDFYRPGERITDDPICITVGSKHRDFETLSAAIDLVHEVRPEARFRAVGTDNNTDKPLRDPRVDYLNDLDDLGLRTAYQSSRVAVLPLAGFTASNALLEAMSCGLPVVASDVGGVAEYLGEQGGLLCAPGDAPALAEAILRLLDDTELAARMGRANAARALGLDYRRAAEGHRGVYERALAATG